ncbi:MAG: hypothetical protein RMM17_03315 [Acidobacteriota bacterium]|nr:hypothetical protein [Blastocatellia bacterium]MDW8411697.1 hypothetical protein [Acidobacteriota bacterium]
MKYLWLLPLVLVACSEGRQPTPITDKEEIPAGEVRSVDTPVGSGYGQASVPSTAGRSSALTGVEKPVSLVELEKSYEANPKDEQLRKRLAQATYEFGSSVMYDESLPPRVKYPQALKLFRRTLELEPGHKEAAAEIEQIKEIYASMGRPVPE